MGLNLKRGAKEWDRPLDPRWCSSRAMFPGCRAGGQGLLPDEVACPPGRPGCFSPLTRVRNGVKGSHPNALSPARGEARGEREDPLLIRGWSSAGKKGRIRL